MERAQAFALVAEEYDRGRPGYPSAAIRWLLGDQPLDVADLGAGTGKLTAALVAEGHRVVAVEPLAEMREVLTSRIPQARVVAGSAEQTGLADASVDAVVAGSAFHWFDRSRAFPEIQRILRAPGTLGVLGNGFDPSSPWAERLGGMIGRSGRGRSRHWIPTEELLEWFQSVDDQEFPHEERVDRERLLDLALSYSQNAVLPADERRELLDQIAGLWDQEPGLSANESVELGYLTRVRRCRGIRPPGEA